MIKLLGEYNAEGCYQHNGKGTQKGKVIYCSDKKIVGIITDREHNHIVSRLVLGVHSEEGRLSLLKIYPLDGQEIYKPVLWTMQATKIENENELSDNYIGHYSFILDPPPIVRDIQRRFGLEDIINLRKSNILIQTLSQYVLDGWFDEEILEEIKFIANKQKYIGGIKFSRV